MFNRYSYKIGDFVMFNRTSYRHPNDFEKRYYHLDLTSAIFTSPGESPAVVTGINNFHIPESSKYVVEIFCPEEGKNVKIGIGNKSSDLRKANIFDAKKKFPSKLEIEAHKLIFADSAR